MDASTYLRFLVALLFVLALIVALAWAARRFGLGGRIAPNASKRRRLSIVEVLPLDGRHRLVLLRRDRVEHLVVLGPSQPLLIEGGVPVAGDGEPAARSFAEALDTAGSDS